MKKLLFSFFLTLGILLLSGYSQLYAHALEYFSPKASSQNLAASGFSSFGTDHYSQALVLLKHLSSVSEKEIHTKIDVAEIEEKDDELTFFKELLESGNYFTALVYTLTLAYFFCFIKTSLLFCKQFSYTLSKRRYLIFQVFRI
ncbi:hypothetical protein [Pontibacter sp. SGAir0037]|uniref:hypothetical protein n=1 Tax=Pontibacter sp. SGAir0037 TaxID=2571030 RepID=UPI0010CCF8D3|nr:hypothetical protein [Pontibacter sp. SGAir0037]QCR22711.1 hypothetical protein C1N53_10385 [Pontibacter sp. SGAir0037]